LHDLSQFYAMLAEEIIWMLDDLLDGLGFHQVMLFLFVKFVQHAFASDRLLEKCISFPRNLLQL